MLKLYYYYRRLTIDVHAFFLSIPVLVGGGGGGIKLSLVSRLGEVECTFLGSQP
jgi:hypothetical protein